MADKKISALPASITPLAGTEVLPIVQNGDTKQVSVANFTAGRDVSGQSFSATGGNVTVPDNYSFSFGVGSTYITGSSATGTVKIDINNATKLNVDVNGYVGLSQTLKPWGLGGGIAIQMPSGSLWGYATGQIHVSQNLYFDGGAFRYANDGRASTYVQIAGTHTWSTSASGLAGDPVTLIDVLSSDVNGNVKVLAANLVISTAGKGIDFSANGGDVLTQYDEGTYVAAITCGTSGTVTLNSSFQTLAYTRVGRQVTVTGFLLVSSVSSPTGYFTVSLPFAISNILTQQSARVAGSIIVGGSVSSVANGFIAYGLPNETVFRVYMANSNNVIGNTSAQQLQANAEIFVQFTYFA